MSGIPLLLAIVTAVAFIIYTGSRLKWPAFFSLLIAALGLGLAIGLPPADVIKTIQTGFGGLIGQVGLLIVLGSIIGVSMERSGAATRIADAVLGKGGNVGLRLVVLGALVSVPVFCDSGFIILAGLLPAMAQRSGRPLAVLALSLAGGLYLTHTLVPPTPGPLAAAANLGADAHLGTLMLLGVVVSIPVALVTWRAAAWLGKAIPATPDFPAGRSEQQPSLLSSLLPLLLPIGLIALHTVLRFLGGGEYAVGRFFLFLTDPTVALLVGCAAALLLPLAEGRPSAVSEALKLAGPVLIVTGLGGAFGAILKASSLADDVAAYLDGRTLPGYALLLLGFGLAALLKTAQGSSTGALVIASSVLFPLLPLAGFGSPVELALLTLAIGGGAMTLSHANDSYFWVVTRFSGISVGDAYRSYTLLTGVMGVTVLGAVLLLYSIFG